MSCLQSGEMLVDKGGDAVLQFTSLLGTTTGERMVDSVTEHFYASMGVNRLRCYVTSLEPG